MLHRIGDKNNSYTGFLLCLIIICILMASVTYEKPEYEKLSLLGMNHSNTISSLENHLSDIVASELTDYSVLKNIDSGNTAADRSAGSGTATACVVINHLFVLIGPCVFFFLFFYKKLVTISRYMIAYIHNLDGMKP